MITRPGSPAPRSKDIGTEVATNIMYPTTRRLEILSILLVRMIEEIHDGHLRETKHHSLVAT